MHVKDSSRMLVLLEEMCEVLHRISENSDRTNNLLVRNMKSPKKKEGKDLAKEVFKE